MQVCCALKGVLWRATLVDSEAGSGAPSVCCSHCMCAAMTACCTKCMSAAQNECCGRRQWQQWHDGLKYCSQGKGEAIAQAGLLCCRTPGCSNMRCMWQWARVTEKGRGKAEHRLSSDGGEEGWSDSDSEGEEVEGLASPHTSQLPGGALAAKGQQKAEPSIQRPMQVLVRCTPPYYAQQVLVQLRTFILCSASVCAFAHLHVILARSHILLRVLWWPYAGSTLCWHAHTTS
eukprot:1137474-Pelagomonas_calceolata.AAC.5